MFVAQRSEAGSVRGQIGTAGEVMQAVGAVIAAVQVLLFGLSERAHLERATPGDRLAAWLACHTATRAAFSTAANALRTSPTLAARIVYWAGSTVTFLVACGISVVPIEVFARVAPLVLRTGEPRLVVSTPQTGIALVDAVVFLVAVLAVVAVMVGFVLVVVYVLLYVIAPRVGRRLLPVLSWLGRNLEVTLRWSAFLFGLGAVLAVVG